MKKLLCFLSVCAFTASFPLPAQAADLAEEKKAIAAATDERSLAKAIESVEERLLGENKYDEYVDFLRSLDRKDDVGRTVINYSIGQARLLQLKYFEESQQWEQYFNQGAALRQEAVAGLTEALKTAAPADSVRLYANLLLWQYRKDQQEPGEEQNLEDLMSSAREFAAAGKDPAPLKKAAGTLASYGEKGKARELYALYFRAFSSQDMSDEKLLSSASDFLKEGNVELAEAAFDSYVGRAAAQGKDKEAAACLEAAKAFAFGDGKVCDPAYAEKMFARAEAAGNAGIFDEETLHLRALNLEHGDEMVAAGKIYTRLAESFPQGQYYGEAMFKSGIIAAYVNGDMKSAVVAFEKISTREPPDAYAVSSLYQLGLLKQWEGDLPAAKELYTRTQAAAGELFMETSALAAKRLEEIEGSKPMDFCTRIFLDNALGAAAGNLTMTKATITSPASSRKGQEISVASRAAADPSGCTAVTLTYYWSGDLGEAAPGSEQRDFKTIHREKGTKVVNLLVMSPNGALDRAVKMIDVK